MIIGVAVRLVHSSLLFKATNHQLIIDNFRPCLTYNQLTILTVHQFLAIATKKGRIYVNVQYPISKKPNAAMSIITTTTKCVPWKISLRKIEMCEEEYE